MIISRTHIRTYTSIFVASVTTVVGVIGISGCSSSNSLSGDAVAKVGSIVIDRPMLSHWMEAVAGGDYFEHIGKQAPRGLVADPPNYSRCIAVAETIVPKTSSGKPGMTREQLATKCKSLNEALKEQALSLLISIEGRVGEGEERGIQTSEADVNRLFAKIKAEQFPKEGAYQTYLAQRNWDQSIEMLQLKRNLITTRLEQKFKEHQTGLKSEEAFYRFLVAEKDLWKTKTICRAGYIVPLCKEYNPAHASTVTAPSIQLEELAGVA